MPMYQFACETCGQPFERKLSMSHSGDVQECPHCGSRETRKRLGAVAVTAGTSAAPRSSAPPPRSPFT
jgi:putative FmdB family regulatory protein